MSDNVNLSDIVAKLRVRRLYNEIIYISAALLPLWISEGKVPKAEDDC